MSSSSSDSDSDMALLFDSDEEAEEERMIMIYAIVGDYMERLAKKRRPSFYVRDRLEWNNHVEELKAEGGDAFARLYRMKLESFTKLCDILRSEVEVHEQMSRMRTS